MSAGVRDGWPADGEGGVSGGGGGGRGVGEVPKKCRCKTTSCLKMYCDCFSAQRPCTSACRCTDCRNPGDKPRARSPALWPASAESMPSLPRDTDSSFAGISSARPQQKGCRCKKSKCLKNYCECRAAGYSCSNSCQCVGCLNVPSKRQDSSQGDGRATRSSSARTPRTTSSSGAPASPMLSAAQHFKFSDNLPKPDVWALRTQSDGQQQQHIVSDDPQHYPASPEAAMAFELLDRSRIPRDETPAQQEQRVLRHLIGSLKDLLADSMLHSIP